MFRSINILIQASLANTFYNLDIKYLRQAWLFTITAGSGSVFKFLTHYGLDLDLGKYPIQG